MKSKAYERWIERGGKPRKMSDGGVVDMAIAQGMKPAAAPAPIEFSPAPRENDDGGTSGVPFWQKGEKKKQDEYNSIGGGGDKGGKLSSMMKGMFLGGRVDDDPQDDDIEDDDGDVFLFARAIKKRKR